MKTRNYFILIASVLIIALLGQGCNKTEDIQTGSVDFGMKTIAENALKSLAVPDYQITAALVTIVNENGEKIYDKEYLEFYSFGEKFVTASLQLNVGRYQLSEFMLVDSSRTVTWATPVEGSLLAKRVENPVPIEFSVSVQATTHLTPQVVRVADHNPDDFGYVVFDVQFVDNFCIGIFFESFCNQWYLDSTIRADGTFAAPFYQSRLVVFGDGKRVSESYLNPGENRIRVPRGFKMYTISVFDCGEQLCFKEVFGVEELLQFTCNSADYLIINCQPEIPDITITPEDIVEPTIEQGVFGMISEPGIDSSATDFYPIQGFITDLYIYKMDAVDTLFMYGPDCYVYPEIYFKPLAIVRTNSQGYYQLPLEVGDYNYMVQTPYGFYIDAYISSRIPGTFSVESDTITYLDIYVSPCAYF
ncbi:hypothetical protein ACFLRQ_01070 [Bacteroidota bacterium]